MNRGGRSIVIVSRDGDYGVEYQGKYYLNDQLKREYRDRTASNKVISYTQRISDVLEKLQVHVSPDEIRAEDEAIEKREAVGRTWSKPAWFSDVFRGVARPPFFEFDDIPDLDDPGEQLGDGNSTKH